MENFEIFIEQLKQSLEKALPGEAAQLKMGPGLRLENQHDFYRNAAVMILLYIKEEKWHFVLMKRPEYKGAHSKQVSLPGGIYEEYDEDMEATALRETREELGIDDSDIRVVGELTRLNIPVSGIEVSPFVGFFLGKPNFQPDPAEVAYLIEIPLQDLLSPEKAKENLRTILNKRVRVPYFHLGGEQVWGATAMMLSEFLEVIRRGEELYPQ